MILPVKQRVRDSFERAATTYDAAAVLQRDVCQRLLNGLQGQEEPANLLDAGCGTGYGLQLLRDLWPNSERVAVDFAPSMVARARARADLHFVADIEALPCRSESLAVWWSNLTVQWCDLDRTLLEAFRVLCPGGCLALSTLGPETFRELRLAFARIDSYRHSLTFLEPQAIGAALERAGFARIRLRRQAACIHYPDLKALLRAVKDIGANSVGDGVRTGMFGRTAWAQLQAAYEAYRTPAGLPARYDVILAYASKETT